MKYIGEKKKENNRNVQKRKRNVVLVHLDSIHIRLLSTGGIGGIDCKYAIVVNMFELFFYISFIVSLLIVLYFAFKTLMRVISAVSGYIAVCIVVTLTILFYPFTKKRKEDMVKWPVSTKIAIALWIVMWLMIAFIICILTIVE